MNLRFLVLTGLLIVSSSLLSISQTCNFDFKVLKNRHIKTISNSEQDFTLILSNNGTGSDEYIITSNNANTDQENPDGSSSASNIDLTSVLLDAGLNQIENPVALDRGESIELNIKLTIPEGLSTRSWNRTEVIAKSSNCPTEEKIVELYLFNPDPEIDE